MVAQTKDFTQPTARPHLDGALQRLKDNADKWAKTSIAERIAMLRKFLDGYVAVAEESVMAGLKAKGIEPGTPLEAEEWLAGPTIVIRNCRLFIETLTRLQKGQPTVDPSRVRVKDG